MVGRIDAAIRAGSVPSFIVILVQGLPDVRYINTKDGTRPLEDVIIKDLIPHVDGAYRTLAVRTSRAIEGMSMGGVRRPPPGVQVPRVVRGRVGAGSEYHRHEG